MGLLDLTELQILQGSFSLLFVMICIILGMKIISKYFEYKRIELIAVGITIVLIASPYSASGFSFVNYILLDVPFDTRLYLFLNLGFTPFGLICWFYAFFHLISPDLKKKVVVIASIILIIWEIFFIFFLIIDPSIIGSMAGIFDGVYTLYTLSYILSVLVLNLTISIIYFLHCQKSQDLEIKWGGRFILVGVITWVIGIFIDIIPMNPLSIVLARLILILFAIEWYIGWLMPKSIVKRLIKRDFGVIVESKEKDDEFHEFMQLLKTKPQKITEEEVIFHREKKICLVCKGKVGGFNTFICIKCNALYCQNCAKHLSNLENQCWVCDTPFDESKPSKPYLIEKDDIILEDKVTKIGKKRNDFDE